KALDWAFRPAARRAEPGSREQAVAILKRSINGGTDLPRLRFLLASLYDDHSEDLVKAVEHYRGGLRLDPTDAAAKNNLAVALLGLGRADEAAELLIETVAENPDYGLAVQNLARIL